MEVKTIAHIHTDFPEKFGIPRQSGMADTAARIVFVPEYRDAAAVRGMSEYSHLWLLWQFSGVADSAWRPTVRPPRLGGNTRMGVFATRSPYRPNPIGLSSVRLERVELTNDRGLVLYVRGADLMDGTPILDIKPYLAYTDAHPDAVCGFADRVYGYALEVVLPDALACVLPADKRAELTKILSLDPRPSYQHEPERVYGMDFSGYQIKFHVKDTVLTVIDIIQSARKNES